MIGSLESLPPCHGPLGWPWTESTPPFGSTRPDGSPWPRISIVTPSYNQGQFIEETIRSCLLQGYPNLEYIIIDGGSQDSTVDILRKYEPWLAHWRCEPDGGQSDAINKGMRLATGDIVGWLNSDDSYLPGALQSVGVLAEADWIMGPTQLTDARGEALGEVGPKVAPDPRLDACFLIPNSKDFLTAQPGHFWSRALWESVGPLNTSYDYCMDFDWMLRALANGHHPRFVPTVMARQRQHPGSKSSRLPWAFDLEKARVLLYLAARRRLRGTPAIRLARHYAARGWVNKSDDLVRHGRHVLAFWYLVGGLLVSEHRRGGSYLSRALRIFGLRPG